MTYMAREPYANFWPKVADTAFVAESADLIGDVTIGEHASVWYHTTLRADINKIVIGDYSNIQDNSCIHLADDFGCYVGKYVTVGHGVILHACTVEDNCLIGMGSIILDGARLSGESASSCSSWGRMFSMLSHTEGTTLIAVPNRTAIIRASEGRASSSPSLSITSLAASMVTRA